MDFTGFTFFEKLMILFRKQKGSFIELDNFVKKETIVNENTVFNGSHKGTIVVKSGCLIFRGSLIGNLVVEEKAEAFIFGKIQGKIQADGVIRFKKNCIVQADLKCRKLIVEPEARLEVNVKAVD